MTLNYQLPTRGLVVRGRRCFLGYFNRLDKLTVCAAVIAVGLTSAPVSAGSKSMIRTLNWSTQNDTVMGGRSSANLAWNKADELVWTGRLSLENNGGFVSIRALGTWFDWSAYDGLEVVLEGAGRTINVTAQRRDWVVRAGGYRAPVTTRTSGETRVFIPFSAFVLKRFGRRINGPALGEDLKSVGRVGLLMADKVEGPFRVILKSITPKRHGAKTRLAAEVPKLLSAAIAQGVPVFNSGDAKGCADIYRKALSQLLKQGKLGVGSLAAHQVSSALKRSPTQNRTDAAWTLRLAIDGVLAQF